MDFTDFHRLIIAAILGMARIGGAFAICPALTDSMIPGVARRAAVFGFAVFVIPMIQQGMPPGEPSVALFGALAFKEALLGFLIGFFAAIPFWIAENIGNFIDNQRGATMGEVYSPLSGAQVSTIGIFFTQLVSTIFFVGGIIFIFLAALYKSYRLWPVFGPGLEFVSDASVLMLQSLDGMMQTAVVIAAPVIIMMFLVTLGLGLFFDLGIQRLLLDPGGTAAQRILPFHARQVRFGHRDAGHLSALYHGHAHLYERRGDIESYNQSCKIAHHGRK